jgi:hypothetical protein
MAGSRPAYEPHAGIKYRGNLFVHQQVSFVLRIDTSARKFRDTETNHLTRFQRQQ